MIDCVLSPVPLRASAAVVLLPLVLFACATPGDGADVAITGVQTTASSVASPEKTLTVEVPVGRKDIARHLPGKVKVIEVEQSSQLSYLRIHDGMRMGTPDEDHARPALSLIKLYLAAYVLEKGSVADKYEALEMIANSSDEFAGELFARYPQSINAIAQRYELSSTRGADKWGFSVTSTVDVVTFISALWEENPTHPILVAMSRPEKVAADGYPQDFGTATLSNVLGTKWGWSDNRDMHSSVSFGQNFIVAAAVIGSAADLTTFVKKEVTANNLRAATKQFLQAKNQAKPVPTFTLEVPTPTASTTAKKNTTTRERK